MSMIMGENYKRVFETACFQEVVNDDYNSWIASALRRSKDFIFVIKSHDMHDSILRPGYDFAIEAWDLGVFTLPFPDIYYQWQYEDEPDNVYCALYSVKTEYTAFKVIGLIGKNEILVPTDNEKEVAEGYMLTLTGLLHTKGVPTERVTPTRQQRRAAERTGNKVYEFTRLDLRNVVSEGGTGVGIQAHRRLHWRRGHFRRLPSGKITSVCPHLVGDKAAGFVEHDYRMKT